MSGNLQYSYAREKLTISVYELLTMSGTDKENIRKIYIHQLSYIEDNMVPTECLSNLQYIKNTLADKSKIPDWDSSNKHGAIYHSCNRLHWRTIKKVKEALWNLFQEICL